jgi:hypothetical protein
MYSMFGFFNLRLALAIASTMLGGFGMFCAVESFSIPGFFGYAVLFLGAAFLTTKL